MIEQEGMALKKRERERGKKKSRFSLYKKDFFFPLRMVRHLKRLLREAVDAWKCLKPDWMGL